MGSIVQVLPLPLPSIHWRRAGRQFPAAPRASRSSGRGFHAQKTGHTYKRILRATPNLSGTECSPRRIRYTAAWLHEARQSTPGSSVAEDELRGGTHQKTLQAAPAVRADHYEINPALLDPLREDVRDGVLGEQHRTFDLVVPS